MENKVTNFARKIISVLLLAVMLLLIFSFFGCREEKEGEGTESEVDTEPIVSAEAAEYTYEDMEEDIAALSERYGDILRVSAEHMSHDDRNIYCIDVGAETAEKQIMVNGGIHGREYMTPLYLMYELEYFLSTADEETLSLLESTMIRIIPMINPDGIAISQGGIDAIRSEELRECITAAYEYDMKNESYAVYGSMEEYLVNWKANARGVDINRNFGIDYWEELKTGATKPSSQKFKGYEAESELETKALVELTEELDNLVCSVSVHSQGELIFWDCGQQGEVRSETVQLAFMLNKMNGYTLYSDFSNPDASYNDWCALNLGVPSVNIETGNGKCPLPIDQFESIFDRNRELLGNLLKHYNT